METGLLLVSPVVIGVAAFALSRQLKRLRWLVHALAIPAMLLIGPFFYFEWLDAVYGPDTPVGAGLALVTFLIVAAVAIFTYLALLFVVSLMSSGFEWPSKATNQRLG
jgi:hypothetical protein